MILNAVNELEQYGVHVRSMNEPFDTSTPAGRLMLTMLSGMAGFERDSILQRSADGMKRLAHEGAWLGGMPPYGYRVVGQDKDARLVISEQPIPGLDMSEADVVRLMYKLIVEDDMSCAQIAYHLNSLGIPRASSRKDREWILNKHDRKWGIWIPSTVRHYLALTTYKGIHQYGKKRAKEGYPVIEREVLPIVDVETWETAQKILTGKRRWSSKNAVHAYMLRGACYLWYVWSHV